MKTERGRAFEENEPALTLEEAFAAYLAGQSAISLRGIPCLSADGAQIEYLAIKFVLKNKEHATVLMDRMTVGALLGLFQSIESIGWDPKRMEPGPTVQ